MNCIEVGELMQRRLDYDLNEQETLQLESHLAQCSSCRMMFERLSMLSTQLAQLPHVTPSISIVDSILPQLLEIDIVKQNEVSSLLNKREEAADVELSHKRKSSSLSKKWMVTASSLVAAAAILLTIGITNINKQSNSDADTSGTMTAFDHATQDERAETFRTRTDDISVAEQSSTRQQEPRLGVEDEISPTTSMSVDHFTKSPSIQGGINVSKNNEADNLPITDGVVEQEHRAKDDYSVAENDNKNNMEWLPAEANEEYGFMTIVEPSLTMSYISPDEKYYIELGKHMITVYDFYSGETINSFEVPIEGDIAFVGWHEEAIEFYIEVTDKQLQTHPLTFVMEQ